MTDYRKRLHQLTDAVADAQDDEHQAQAEVKRAELALAAAKGAQIAASERVKDALAKLKDVMACYEEDLPLLAQSEQGQVESPIRVDPTNPALLLDRLLYDHAVIAAYPKTCAALEPLRTDWTRPAEMARAYEEADAAAVAVEGELHQGICVYQLVRQHVIQTMRGLMVAPVVDAMERPPAKAMSATQTSESEQGHDEPGATQKVAPEKDSPSDSDAEPWRAATLTEIIPGGKRVHDPLHRAGLDTLGDLADYLALGRSVVALYAPGSKSTGTVEDAIRSWWLDHTEEGRRGQLPAWMPKKMWPPRGSRARIEMAVGESFTRWAGSTLKWSVLKKSGATDAEIAATLVELYGTGGITHHGENALQWFASSKNGVPMLWVDARPPSPATVEGFDLVDAARRKIKIPCRDLPQERGTDESVEGERPNRTGDSPADPPGREGQPGRTGSSDRDSGASDGQTAHRGGAGAPGTEEEVPSPTKLSCAVCGCPFMTDAPGIQKCPACIHATDRGTQIWKHNGIRAAYRLYLLADRVIIRARSGELGNWGQDLPEEQWMPSLADLMAHVSKAAGCALSNPTPYDIDGGDVGCEFDRPDARPPVPKGELFPVVEEKSRTAQEEERL